MTGLHARLTMIYALTAFVVVLGTVVTSSVLLEGALSDADEDRLSQATFFMAAAIEIAVDDVENVAEGTAGRPDVVALVEGSEERGLRQFIDRTLFDTGLDYAVVLDASGSLLARDDSHRSARDVGGRYPGSSASLLGLRQTGLALRDGDDLVAYAALPVLEVTPPFTPVGTLILGRRLVDLFDDESVAGLGIRARVVGASGSTAPSEVVFGEEVALASWIDLTEWGVDEVVVEVGVPLEASHGRRAAHDRVLALAGGLSLLAGFLLASLLARRTVKPLTHLEERMAAFGVERAVQDAPIESTVNEIASLVEAFEGMARKVVDQDTDLATLTRNRDRFVSSVAHEIRTPLASVMGFAEVLLTEEVDVDERSEFLEAIFRESDHLRTIVDDLLVVGRLDIGVEVYPEFTSLTDLARRWTATIPEDLASGKRIRIEGDDDVVVWADPRRTTQVLRNLVTNAVRHGGREIVVRVFEEGSLGKVEVRDDGDGVPEGFEGDAFLPFESGAARRGLTDAMGLGLYVSRRLAARMGGTLTYRRDGGETVFTMGLPLHRDDPAEYLDPGPI